MKNKLEDLRNHLFVALEGLLDEEKPLEIERAKAVAQVGAVLVETAKVEVKAIEVMKLNGGTGFLQLAHQEGPRS